MRMHPEDFLALVPDGLPPFELVGPDVADEVYGFRQTVGDETLSRSALWAAALQTEFERSGMWLRVPNYETASFGFVDFDDEPRFGVTVHGSDTGDRSRGRGRDAAPDIHVGNLYVEDQQFPVVANLYGRGRDHQYVYPPDHPTDATAACWAVARSVPSGPVRLLTAAHVLHGLAVGDSVDLTHGQLATTDHDGVVAAFAPPRVDAGLIEPDNQCHAPGGHPLTVRRLVPPGTRAVFRGQNSGITSTLVREVSNPRISVERNYLNVEFLVLLEDAGAAGDSGALVQADDGSDDVIALYLGEADDINGKDTYGRCQLMRQVELCLDVTLLS